MGGRVYANILSSQNTMYNVNMIIIVSSLYILDTRYVSVNCTNKTKCIVWSAILTTENCQAGPPNNMQESQVPGIKRSRIESPAWRMGSQVS